MEGATAYLREADVVGEKRRNMTVSVCKDFLRGKCSRQECRYAHPEGPLARDGDELTVCNDFLRGRCSREAGCRYFHPPPHLRRNFETGDVSRQVLSPVARVDWMPQPLAVTPPMANGGGLRPTLTVCRDFIRGRCQREASECKYAHVSPSSGQVGEDNTVIVCNDFMKDRCERSTCKYFHPPEHLRLRVKQGGSGSAGPMGMPGVMGHPGMVNGGVMSPVGPSMIRGLDEPNAKRMCLDPRLGAPAMGGSPMWPQPGMQGGLNPAALQGINPAALQGLNPAAIQLLMSLGIPPMAMAMPTPMMAGGHHPDAMVAKPMVSPQPIQDSQKLPVCRDFLKDKCTRKDGTCRYIHPGPEVQVLDLHVTLCRDATRGRCNREACRFYHPPSSAPRPSQYPPNSTDASASHHSLPPAPAAPPAAAAAPPP